MHSLIRKGTFLFLRLFCFAFFIDDVTVSDPERISRAEKGSAQASAHPLSQAQGGLFCLCLFVAGVKCTRCERLLPVKHFYLTCLLFFRRLKITLDSEQPMLKEKRITPSVSSGIKGFEHF